MFLHEANEEVTYFKSSDSFLHDHGEARQVEYAKQDLQASQ